MPKSLMMLLWLCGAGYAAAVETEVQYLSGHGKDDAVPWDFFCTGGMRSNVWVTIPVPSCWEQQGFGAYGYQVDPLKEQGQYRTRFAVPTAWKGKVVRLVFEGAMTDTEAWINGQSAGPRHQGGFYRFKYDITRHVKFGETNLLEATVAKVSADEGVNRAERKGDYWNFGGIFRPVYLEALPPTYIDRLAIDARADGSFALEVFLGGDLAKAERVSAVIEGLGATAEATVDPATGKAVLQVKAGGQKNWTAETPNLYWAKVAVLAQGRPVHEVRQRFGFRTVDVREGKGLFVNGQRVWLKGANRHSFWPESGRTLSEAISRSDVLLMKEMNMNAVRMSHYPPDAHFLETCDELGLYVLDELSGWQKAHDTPVGEKLVKELVTRDVNHPSIVLWDNGNEGGWNTDLDDDFALWDPQGRHVMHPWALSQGIDTSHYKYYEEVKAKCAGNVIYMPTEFLHALYDGGGGAGLDDYWNVMQASPVSAGGFIWALVDEGVMRTDQGGKIDVNGNRAPDGLVGPHREREGSFNAVREIWCPVQVRGDALPALTVENRYDFIALDQCRFDWKLACFPLPLAAATGLTVVACASVSGPSVAPHASGSLKLDLPAGWKDADVLYVTARNPEGREIWTWSWPLQKRDAMIARAVKGGTAAAVRVVEEGAQIKMTTGDLSLSVSKTDGMLSAVSVCGKPVSILNGPRFVASATKTVQKAAEKAKKSKSVSSMLDLSGSGKLTRLEALPDGMRAVYEGPLQEACWSILPGGWVKLTYTYRLEQACDLAGVQFDYPEKQMKSVQWLGQGPYRVWKNRLKGTCWGVWQNAYNDTTPGESWGYPEFKGYFGDWLWATFTTSEGRITLASGAERSYLGVYRPNEGMDPALVKLHTLQTGLAFLDAIPAIGTKFGRAKEYGPQSQPNPAPGLCRRVVYLHFEN